MCADLSLDGREVGDALPAVQGSYGCNFSRRTDFKGFQGLLSATFVPCRSGRVPCLDQLAIHQRKTLHTRPCTFHTTHGTVHIS